MRTCSRAEPCMRCGRTPGAYRPMGQSSSRIARSKADPPMGEYMTAPRLAIAYALDLLVGDPEWFPHPVRGFGLLTRSGELLVRPFTSGPTSEILAGAALTISVASVGWAL